LAGGVSLSDEHCAVLVAVFERAEPKRFVSLDGTTERKRVLLAIKWRVRIAAIKGGW
jgi:hypothetical protein